MVALLFPEDPALLPEPFGSTGTFRELFVKSLAMKERGASGKKKTTIHSDGSPISSRFFSGFSFHIRDQTRASRHSASEQHPQHLLFTLLLYLLLLF